MGYEVTEITHLPTLHTHMRTHTLPAGPQSLTCLVSFLGVTDGPRARKGWLGKHTHIITHTQRCTYIHMHMGEKACNCPQISTQAFVSTWSWHHVFIQSVFRAGNPQGSTYKGMYDLPAFHNLFVLLPCQAPQATQQQQHQLAWTSYNV